MAKRRTPAGETRFRDGAFYAVETLSDHIDRTPEGYLICHDVAISRVGDFPYRAAEAGLKSHTTGVTTLRRTADELFRPETVASYEGKPVTIGHAAFVTPDNWRERAVGVVQNVHRGEGSDADKLIADLLITDARGIRAVEGGTYREVSCGYDAEPVDDGNGVGHQVAIVGNHVALVQKGRCGDTCSIRDEETMARLSPKTILRRLFKDGDEDKFESALDDMEVKHSDEVEDEDDVDTAPEKKPAVIDEDRIAGIERSLEDIKVALGALAAGHKTEDEDDTEPSEDEIAGANEEPPSDPEEEDDIVPEDEARETLKDADDIAPGIKQPSEKEISIGLTRDQVDRIKRQAISKSDSAREFGDSASLSGAALDTAFRAAVLLNRRDRNPRAVAFGDSRPSGRTNADLNKRFSDYWRNK